MGERAQVLDHLRSPRFAYQLPTEVFASLLDEGTYLCSIRTMYRILAAQGEVVERRRVVGWRVEHAESATLFKALFTDAVEKHGVPRDQLTLHADRGGPMKAPIKMGTTALMLSDLGVLKSHSRPHTSNDNPFAEAHFKTMKYQPEFPRTFEPIEQARTFCRRVFAWYNEAHHHAGIGLMTSDQLHFGQAEAIHTTRQATLDATHRSTPERFVRNPPQPPKTPTAVRINPPKPTEGNQA